MEHKFNYAQQIFTLINYFPVVSKNFEIKTLLNRLW